MRIDEAINRLKYSAEKMGGVIAAHREGYQRGLRDGFWTGILIAIVIAIVMLLARD